MVTLTAKQLEAKRHFAGEAIPSMKRRRNGHDYEARQIYLITMTVEGRRPLLGRLAGNPELPHGAPDAPRIILSPLGEAVQREWMAISSHRPEIGILALQLMPDHLHGILFVRECMPCHLGQVIKGFKIATNRAYRKLVLGVQAAETTVLSTAIESQYTKLTDTKLTDTPPSVVPSAAIQSQLIKPHTDRKHGLLWSTGYTDGILDRKGQLKNWQAYLRDNPRRLLMKRLHPEFFRIRRDIKIGDYTFSAIGNLFLLKHPVKLQVQCSRRLTETDIEERKKHFLSLARQGAVLASPSISPGEKAVMRAAFEEGLPLIILQENGFGELAKPGGARFDACAEGRLLILAPWEHHNQRLTINRTQCLSLNEMTKVVCENLT